MRVYPSDRELRQKVKAAVLKRLDGQVDEAYLDSVIARVLEGIK